MNQFDLQQLLDRELKRLPAPRAPRTLLPRVLAATVQGVPSRPQSGWLVWPRSWQIASAALLLALAAGGWMLWPILMTVDFGARPMGNTGNTPSRIATVVRSADEGAAIVRVLWQVVLQPIATWVSVLAIALTLACGVLWTALERFALGGASQR